MWKFWRKLCKNQNIFQYTIPYEGKSFSCLWDRTRIYLIFFYFHLFKYVVIIFLRVRHSSSHFFTETHALIIFQVSTFQPKIMCSTSFKCHERASDHCLHITSVVSYVLFYLKTCEVNQFEIRFRVSLHWLRRLIGHETHKWRLKWLLILAPLLLSEVSIERQLNPLLSVIDNGQN